MKPDNSDYKEEFFEGSLEELTKPPNKVDSDIETVVTVPNKSTIILGGVEKVTDSKGGKKVPLLGDIPLIGGLFRSVAEGSNQDRLYIFVKAHILRPGSDLALEDVKKAREHYEFYIKVTADVEQKIVIIGGEYHVDAETLLLNKYGGRQGDIWGGGFNLRTKRFETNALINLRTGKNDSMEIIDSKAREAFLSLVKSKLQGIEDLL